MEAYFETISGKARDVRKGIIGRVAREWDCNAYEEDPSPNSLEGGAIRAYRFRVYQLGGKIT